MKMNLPVSLLHLAGAGKPRHLVRESRRHLRKRTDSNARRRRNGSVICRAAKSKATFSTDTQWDNVWPKTSDFRFAAIKASAEQYREILAGQRLAAMIGDVVSVRKTTEAYLDLKRRVDSGRCFTVGDQIDRDISAAAATGFSTFYFPGGFAPYWISDLDTSGARQID